MKSKRGRVAAREPQHHERGYAPKMSAHQSHGSPASRNARIGNGEKAGAGELDLPGNGPGPAARRVRGLPATAMGSVGSNSAPRGMSTYREE